MQYYIVINQYGVAKSGLIEETDLVDWAIISYLSLWYLRQSGKEKVLFIEGERYIWINYSHLMTNMPLLKITNKSNIARRIRKLANLGLIRTHTAPDNTMYFMLTPLCLNIIAFSGDKGTCCASATGVLRESNRGVASTQQHNNITSNNITSNNNIIYALFENFWKEYPKKRSRGQALKAWQKLKVDEALFREIMQGLERAKKSKDWQKEGGKYIPYPATWLNAQGWLDEFEEYQTKRGGEYGSDDFMPYRG